MGSPQLRQCGMEWDHPHLFGVEVVAVFSMGVPVLDTDSGPPLTATDFRDAVVPQPRDLLIRKTVENECFIRDLECVRMCMCTCTYQATVPCVESSNLIRGLC